MVKLVISDNDGTTTVVPLVRGDISIGRRQGNTIRLTERNVSRDHAQLRRRDGTFQITDLDSYNGVQVNGQAISGEHEISQGDEIRIGDYTMSLQIEGQGAGPGAKAPTSPPTTPARLVMMSDPSPGAEFSLPASGIVRVGRSEDLEIPVNHPSVSRVHAELVCGDEGYTARDLNSANGAIVGGDRISERTLVPGDIVEFGQVVFRFVGPGEHYFFDPSETASHRRVSEAGGPDLRLVFGAIAVAAAVAAAVYYAGVQPEDGPEGGDAPALATADSTATDLRHAASLKACQEALAQGRPGEALAHAALAIAERPGDPDAERCNADARQRFQEQQAFDRGKSALALGDLLTAHKAFLRLGPDSPLRRRPEVVRTIAGIADAELQEAEGLLSSDPVAARVQAETVATMPGLDDKRRQAARELAERAAKGRTARKRPTKSAAKTRAPKKRPSASSAAATAKSARTATKPAAGGAGAANPASSSAASTEDTPEETPMKRATACLAKGDNQCVIAALSGKANTANEMALLIETYRALGNAQAATKYMAKYVERFPNARRAAAYKQTLDRQGQ